MKEFYKDLYKYNHESNQKLAEVFKENRAINSEKNSVFYSHILNAHHIWNKRMIGESPVYGVWDIHDVANYKEIDSINYKNSLELLENADYEELISYVNFQGELLNKYVKDIIFHVVNHSTYHRGQIAIELRQNGIPAISSDYIFYKS